MKTPALFLVLLAGIGLPLLSPSHALADAVTYQGTLGKAAIVLELSQPADAAKGKVIGRYFYQAKGIDIPLDAAKAAAGTVDLAEEKPCGDDLCKMTDDGEPAGPAPVGAKWHLVAGKDGATVSGTWSAGGKSLPLALTRVGVRKLPGDFDGTTASLAAIMDDLSDG